MKLGIMFGNPETTPGGNALKFYSSLRMDIRSIGKIEGGNTETKEVVGNRVRVKIVKNKIAPPFKTAEFDIMYNKGISFTGDLLDLSSKYEITRKSGAFYTYKDLKLGQGRENAKSFLATNNKVLKDIEKEVLDLISKMKKDEDAANNANSAFPSKAAISEPGVDIEDEEDFAPAAAATRPAKGAKAAKN